MKNGENFLESDPLLQLALRGKDAKKNRGRDHDFTVVPRLAPEPVREAEALPEKPVAHAPIPAISAPPPPPAQPRVSARYVPGIDLNAPPPAPVPPKADPRSDLQKTLRSGTRNAPYQCVRKGRISQRWTITIDDEIAERERAFTQPMRGLWNRIRFIEMAISVVMDAWEQRGWNRVPPTEAEFEQWRRSIAGTAKEGA